MKLRPAVFAAAVLAALAGASSPARAAVCNLAPCVAEIQAAAGLVVNDVFKDNNGLLGNQLPVYGKIVDNWPGCPEHVNFAGAGHSTPPFNCPGQYVGDGTTPTVANANTFLSQVDRYWWQPCRLGNPNLMDIGGGTMCVQNWSCIADGTGGNYLPWEGLVFDLGGPSNKVAIFAENDHGPQPCESLEYTVYLTDNPYAHDVTDLIQSPATQGVDPQKWNRAVLSKIYTWGWTTTRQPDPANFGVSCGDNAQYAVEEDSFVQVFSLPCGITFRYAAIIAGNDGLDFASCGYDSNEGEIDAVAGLTETGAAVCPDADNDHFVDCNCPGAPPVCDCDDSNPAVHPGAPEACDSTDINCDGIPGMCTGDAVCYQSVCVPTCSGGENPFCPAGSTCTLTPEGNICVPQDCTLAGCPPGGTCKNGICVPVCDTVMCPGNQICQDGNCIDPCAGVQCPAGQLCEKGVCVFPCNCFAGDVGCAPFPNTICDRGNTDLCISALCAQTVCGPSQSCDPNTGLCVDFCNPNVICPDGQKCVDPLGCIGLCEDVVCDPGFLCNPKTGQCDDQSCIDVTCFAPQVCMMGQCVLPDGGAAGGAGGAGGATGGSAAGGQGGTSAAGGRASGSGGADPGDTGSCGCRVPGDDDRDALPGAGALALLGLAAIAARRRSSRR